MVLDASNQLLESNVYGREKKGSVVSLPTSAYLSASLTAKIFPHVSEVKTVGSNHHWFPFQKL